MTSSSSSKAGSTTGSINKKDGGSSVVGSNNKLLQESKKNGSSNVGSNKSGVSMKKEYRYFLGEFLCLEPEDVWQRAQELEIPYFKEEGVNCHPALVHLVELMTGKSIRDAVRADMLKDFEIALPIWVPFKSLVQSKDNYGFQHFPYIVNIDMSFYSDIPIQFWNDRLIDACAEGQPNKVHLCLDNGADVNYQDCRGWSPLHCIANILHDRAFISDNRKKQCFDLIIEKKANLHARTLRGEKPLALAELRGFDKCADFIRAENLIPIKEESTKEQNQELPLVKGLRLKELF